MLSRATCKEIAGFLAEKDTYIYIPGDSGGSQELLPWLITQALGFDHYEDSIKNEEKSCPPQYKH